MNTQQEHALQMLKSKKEIALSTTAKHFPSQFYAFAEMILNNPFLMPITQLIQKEAEKNRNHYTEVFKNNPISDPVEESHTIRRMDKIYLGGALYRISLIYRIYNPEIYKLTHDSLLKSGRAHEAHVLAIQYAGLRRCIDPESLDKSSYNECFDMEADKIAIQDLYFFIEQALTSSDDANPTIKVSRKNKKFLQISAKGIKRNVKIDSTRGKIILFFAKNKKSTSENLYKKIRDGLGATESEKVINWVKDTNKFFNHYFKISAALNIKSIPSHYDPKLEITRNSLHWD